MQIDLGPRYLVFPSQLRAEAVSPHFGADVGEVLDFERSVRQRAAPGGTAPVAVQAQLEQAKRALSP